MNNHLITYSGTIVFDPINYTAKHHKQHSWKKVAMVMIDGDICEYYSWFIMKRYNLYLNNPLRSAHISFINDAVNDINGGVGTNDEKNNLWSKIKAKYNNTTINIVLDLDAKTNGEHWYMIVNEEDRKELHNIRTELGLGRPYFGLHMSIGYAVDKYDVDVEGNGIRAKRMNVAHCEYIHEGIKNGFII